MLEAEDLRVADHQQGQLLMQVAEAHRDEDQGDLLLALQEEDQEDLLLVFHLLAHLAEAGLVHLHQQVAAFQEEVLLVVEERQLEVLRKAPSRQSL
jgi:hypothetical protein